MNRGIQNNPSAIIRGTRSLWEHMVIEGFALQGSTIARHLRSELGAELRGCHQRSPDPTEEAPGWGTHVLFHSPS